MHPTRRQLLCASGLGFGSLALSWLTHASNAQRAGNALAPRVGHFPAKARSIIMLVQNGGPSQMDLFDPKLGLKKFDGKTHSEKVETFQKGSEPNKLLASPLAFRKYGEAGVEMAEILPHLGSVIDRCTLVRSAYNYHNNHTESLVALATGRIFQGRPTLGSWVSYALGTENDNLPSYVVLRDPKGYNTSGSLLWQNGWLPAVHRGTEFRTTGQPVANLQPTKPVDPEARADDLDLLAKLQSEHLKKYPDESALEARIQNYELAARMQLAAAKLLDLSTETKATNKLYGLDNPTTRGYGLRCLLARRLVESGVRFVQVFPPVEPQFQPWDAHGDVKTQNEQICARCDLGSAALIRDLAQRGLLDETIVLWSGEFGRLPISQNKKGRDHNRNAFSLLLSGGGFRSGHIHGATDEVGYRAVEKRLSVNDLHATLLHQLGLDHRRLTFEHHGRPETPTDSVVTKARVEPELFENEAMCK